MLEWVTERLFALLEPITALARDRRDLRDNALRTISTALNETSIYYRDLGLGKPRNPDVEAQLSRYWAAAAVPIRHLDPQLAEVCEHKSEYWLDPEQWTDAEIRRLGIGLSTVRDHYRSILWRRPLPHRRSLLRPDQV